MISSVRGAQEEPHTEVKGDVSNVASAILDGGSNIANDVSSEGKALQSKAAVDTSTQVSVAFDGGAGMVASIMSEVNSIVNDDTSVVEIITGGITSGMTTNVGQSAAFASGSTNSSTTSSEPQDLLPQSHSSTTSPISSRCLILYAEAKPRFHLKEC